MLHLMKPRFKLVMTAVVLLGSHTTWSAEPSVPLADGLPSALTIAQATDLAVKSNLDLIAAKFNVSAAEADELTAGLWNNPSLLIDTSLQPFGKNWNQVTAGGPRQYDLILSYPFDLSGKHSSAAKSAHAAKRVAEATFLDAIRQKVLQIRLAYIDLLAADYQLGLSRERHESMNRLVLMIENRIGNKGRLPLLQRRARLALQEAALDVRQRETALKTAKTSLAILLNRPPVDSSITAASKLRDIQLVSLPPQDALEKLALDSRPDLDALRLGTEKADFDAALAHAQVWDDFTVTAGISRQGATAPNPGDPSSAAQPGAYSWNAGVTIPLPVFNRSQGNIQKAAVTKEQSIKQTESLVLSIRQEISSDYEQLKLNDGLIRDYEGTQLAYARQVRDAQQTLFGTGGSALLDYFDAVNAYQSTLSSYYDTVAEYRRSLARLNAAIGKDVLP